MSKYYKPEEIFVRVYGYLAHFMFRVVCMKNYNWA